MLTFVEIFLPIAGADLRAELVPQSVELSLDGVQACHRGLKETRLNDAHLDSKVVDVPPAIIKTRTTTDNKHYTTCCFMLSSFGK